MADEIIIETTSTEVVEVGVPGPQGPAGAAGTGLTTLTTQGDTLYRGASTGERLPIGTTGQVLKVSAQGLPTWANESGSVSSVNGETGAVTLNASDVGAAQAVTTIELTLNGTNTITTAQLPARGIAFADGNADFTVNLPTPSIRESGLWFSLKTEYEGAAGDVFITVVHNATTLGIFELPEAEGSIDFVWDGYEWGYSSKFFLASYSGRILFLPQSGGVIARISDMPAASSTAPAALGTAAVGTGTTFARADHVHSADFSDAVFRLSDNGDATKKLAFELSGISTGTVRTLTVPDASGTIARTEDFAAPPAIGSTTPAAGSFTTLNATGTTELVNGGTTAGPFRLYNTSSSSNANYERGFMRWSSNVLQIGTEKGGTGSARNLELLTDNVWRGRFQSEGLLLNSNGPRVYFGSPLISGDGESGFSLDLQPFGSGNVIIRSGLLKMNGTTNAFPALKRSSTTLQVRLADDSAFAPLVASDIGIGVTPERPLHIQGSTAFIRLDRTGSNGPAFLFTRMTTAPTVDSSWLFGPATNVGGVANDDFAIIDYGTSTSGTSGTQRLTISKSTGQLTVNGNLNLSTKDLVTDTTTGTKIGTGTTQKLGFFNATPIVRPAAIADATDAATTQARLNDLLAAMRSLGLIAT